MLHSQRGGESFVLIDLGCGDGSSYDSFCELGNNLHWVGLDISDSPEVRLRNRRDAQFCTYDGRHIPLASCSVDMVYSHQVFEHVRHPQEVLLETHRILKEGGCLVGSTSHLEPFHSRSYWNYTPFGFCALLQAAGFRDITVRPGIDGPTLIFRRLLAYVRCAKALDGFFERESPLNLMIEGLGRLCGASVPRINSVKLIFCGQFVFTAKK